MSIDFAHTLITDIENAKSARKADYRASKAPEVVDKIRERNAHNIEGWLEEIAPLYPHHDFSSISKYPTRHSSYCMLYQVPAVSEADEPMILKLRPGRVPGHTELFPRWFQTYQGSGFHAILMEHKLTLDKALLKHKDLYVCIEGEYRKLDMLELNDALFDYLNFELDRLGLKNGDFERTDQVYVKIEMCGDHAHIVGVGFVDEHCAQPRNAIDAALKNIAGEKPCRPDITMLG